MNYAAGESTLLIEPQAPLDEAWAHELSAVENLDTDGTGGAYRKDMVYLEGNVRVWQHPNLIMAGDRGKFDITNLRHIMVLQEAGILPKA